MRTVLVILAFLLIMGTVGRVEYEVEQRQLPRIEEDHALWDCATMGNFICGPSYPFKSR